MGSGGGDLDGSPERGLALDLREVGEMDGCVLGRSGTEGLGIERGDGPLAGEVRACAARLANIEYLGMQPQQAVADAMGAATGNSNGPDAFIGIVGGNPGASNGGIPYNRGIIYPGDGYPADTDRHFAQTDHNSHGGFGEYDGG